MELSRHIDLLDAERTRRQDAEHVLRLIAAHPEHIDDADAVTAYSELVNMARQHVRAVQ